MSGSGTTEPSPSAETLPPLPPIEELRKGPIAWFVLNPVAANLLMVLIIFLGMLSALNIPRTLTPDFDLDLVLVNFIYPGASSSEVEKSVLLRAEEALRAVDGIETVVSVSRRNGGFLYLQVEPNFDVVAVQAEVRSAIDSVPSFPRDLEVPVVERIVPTVPISELTLYGDVDPVLLREQADRIEDELLRLPEIHKVRIRGAHDYEISIELDEYALRKYQLSLQDVGLALARASIDLPGGAVRTTNGDVLVQASGRRRNQQQFEEVQLLSFPDGTQLRLGDIATVHDGFVEDGEYQVSSFNRQPAIGLEVEAISNNTDVVEMANAARAYAEQAKKSLPDGVGLAFWADVSTYLKDRLSMMRKNMLLGALLVFLVLSLFIDLKLAFWVMLGLPISFLGAFAVMGQDPFNVTINLLSLFAMILVLGIVVDDAIIVGESAYRSVEQRGHSVDTVIAGVKRVAVPATFGVLTTVVAFLPTIMVEGRFAAFPREIGLTVILCLLFSLLESKWILPAHLAHTRPSSAEWLAPVRRMQAWCNGQLDRYLHNVHQPFLRYCIERRYTVAAIFTGVFILSLGLVLGGIVRLVLVEKFPGDFVVATLEMVDGTPGPTTAKHLNYIEQALWDIDKRHYEQTGERLLHVVRALGKNSLEGEIWVELVPNEERSIDGHTLLNQWRETVGQIPGAKVLIYTDAQGGPGGSSDIAVLLKGEDRALLEEAAVLVEKELASIDGVIDQRSDISVRNDEIVLSSREAAEVLGLPLADVANQVRHAFQGYEVQRVQRGNDEVRVWVRYPRGDRESLATLQNMHVRNNTGETVPLSAVADLDVRPGPSQLVRVDGISALRVTANVEASKISGGQAVKLVYDALNERLERDFNVEFALGEESEDETEMVRFLLIGFLLSMLANYCLIAVPLRSYAQPLLIMGAIPFGIIGAIIGHLVLGLAVSMLSLFGMIAVAGVVVNDGLLLVDFINRAVREQGMSPIKAAVAASRRRFRAIMLTSLTTFVGLMPIMVERSAQARYVIPMAVSLAFGVVFATLITLILLPCLYVVLTDLQKLPKQLLRRTLRLGAEVPQPLPASTSPAEPTLP